MNAELQLTATDENDGTFMVSVRARSGTFSGEGTACFGGDELLEFTSKIEHLVRTFNGQPEVFGGFFTESGEPKTVLVRLKLYAANRTGRLGVIAEVASSPASNELVQQEQRAIVAFSAEPGMVEKFAREIADVVHREREAAILHGEAGAV
jgi:hypothetical protein